MLIYSTLYWLLLLYVIMIFEDAKMIQETSLYHAFLIWKLTTHNFVNSYIWKTIYLSNTLRENTGKYGPEKLRIWTLFTQWYSQLSSTDPSLKKGVALEKQSTLVVVHGVLQKSYSKKVYKFTWKHFCWSFSLIFVKFHRADLFYKTPENDFFWLWIYLYTLLLWKAIFEVNSWETRSEHSQISEMEIFGKTVMAESQ